MNVPRNVLRFEALLYVSLMIDALSVAFQDRTPPPGVTEEMIRSVTMFNGGMILLYLYFVWLAARKTLELAPVGADGGARALGAPGHTGDLSSGLGTRQQRRDRVLRADGNRAVLLLHWGRAGLVRRIGRSMLAHGITGLQTMPKA